ncbi:tigger transposable element-derived protein 6-like [Rhizophagus irregularis DAOM 181602=DAOM 197198]|nr:tigger transposable element-derived protein 6-like [Rhizophagus irregularis DAOM 181602=DAOM 197198]
MPQLQRKRKITHDSLQPKKRVVLTHAQKRQLCLDSQKTSRLTQQELAAIYQIKQNTVSDILKNKDKWLLVNPDSEEANKQRERPPCFPQVEEALALWLTNALAAGVIINGDILREKAKIFARGFEIDNFTASNGWLEKFKQRHHLKEYVKWGEANSAPLETLEEERRKLREIIKDYDLNNVFNCDETGLYWDLEPSKTLAQGPLSGKKKSKKRVTLLLTCNATGTEKLKPTFIHTYQNPRILRGKKRKNCQLITTGIQQLGCKFRYGMIILQNWMHECDYNVAKFF